MWKVQTLFHLACIFSLFGNVIYLNVILCWRLAVCIHISVVGKWKNVLNLFAMKWKKWPNIYAQKWAKIRFLSFKTNWKLAGRRWNMIIKANDVVANCWIDIFIQNAYRSTKLDGDIDIRLRFFCVKMNSLTWCE